MTDRVFDTTVVSGLVRDEVAADVFGLFAESLKAQRAIVSAVTTFEIYKGLKNAEATREGRRRGARAADFLRQFAVVPLDHAIAIHAAELFNRTSQRPELCDIFIITTAVVLQAELVTADERSLPFIRTVAPKLQVHVAAINVRTRVVGPDVAP